MKKIIIAVIITGVFMSMFFSGCTSDAERQKLTFAAAEEFNQHSDIEYGLLSEAGSDISGEAVQYGSTDRTAPPYVNIYDSAARGYYFIYPKNADVLRLTQLYIEKQSSVELEKCHVFGIRIGDRINDVQAVMAQYGYKHVKKLNTKTYSAYGKELNFMLYRKQDIGIEFRYNKDDTKIYMITVDIYE